MYIALNKFFSMENIIVVQTLENFTLQVTVSFFGQNHKCLFLNSGLPKQI